MSKLSCVMPPERLRILTNGIFFSLLSYGLQIYVSVSGEYSEGPGRLTALTRDDSHKIQVVMNVVLRAMTNLDVETSVWQLLYVRGFLSFHQMCAYSTICTTILIHKVPKYLYDILVVARQDLGIARRVGTRSSPPTYSP